MKEFIAKIRGKLFIFRCSLARKNIIIGAGLKIYKRLSIEGQGKVFIGINCIADGIRGDKSQYVSIDTHSPDATIHIGNNANLHAARISSRFSISIGEGVLIEESGIADTDFHVIDKTRSTPSDENREKCEIVIGNRVCIGAKSFVMKGVKIGDDAVIGPGSVVVTSVGAGSLVFGNPAKIFTRHS